MKIGVIIPDRGDRPKFMNHCNWLLSQQTLQPDEVYIVNEPPRSENIDITYRYKKGYEYFRYKKMDVLFLWENDDWYSRDYISVMLAAWHSAERPKLFGQRSTEYYNIKTPSHFTFHHESRSSAMSTIIKPDLLFDWCIDSEPYTDVWLYSKLEYKLFQPRPLISIGIKHGVGRLGGMCHGEDMEMYKKHGTLDSDYNWLRNIIDPVSFKFYSTFFSEGIISHTLPN